MCSNHCERSISSSRSSLRESVCRQTYMQICKQQLTRVGRTPNQTGCPENLLPDGVSVNLCCRTCSFSSRTSYCTTARQHHLGSWVNVCGGYLSGSGLLPLSGPRLGRGVPLQVPRPLLCSLLGQLCFHCPFLSNTRWSQCLVPDRWPPFDVNSIAAPTTILLVPWLTRALFLFSFLTDSNQTEFHLETSYHWGLLPIVSFLPYIDLLASSADTNCIDIDLQCTSQMSWNEASAPTCRLPPIAFVFAARCPHDFATHSCCLSAVLRR